MAEPVLGLTKDEYNAFSSIYSTENSDCFDNFSHICFEATRYVNYLTHLSHNYCSYSCYRKTIPEEVYKEAIFWYITISNTYINQQDFLTAPQRYVYQFLMEKGYVLN